MSIFKNEQAYVKTCQILKFLSEWLGRRLLVVYDITNVEIRMPQSSDVLEATGLIIEINFHPNEYKSDALNSLGYFMDTVRWWRSQISDYMQCRLVQELTFVGTTPEVNIMSVDGKDVVHSNPGSKGIVKLRIAMIPVGNPFEYVLPGKAHIDRMEADVMNAQRTGGRINPDVFDLVGNHALPSPNLAPTTPQPKAKPEIVREAGDNVIRAPFGQNRGSTLPCDTEPA